MFFDPRSFWSGRLQGVLWAIAIPAVTAGLLLVGCSGGGSNEPLFPRKPPSPSGLSAQADDGTVNLEWDSVDEEVKGYNVYRSSSSIESISELSPVNGSALGEPNYSDDGVENGTTYYYLVTSVSSGGEESSPSNQVQSTPFPEPPGRP